MCQLARSFAPFGVLKDTATHNAGSLVKFSLPAAKRIRKRRPKASDKWHLDEVRVKIRGQIYWLWRAVDDEGTVLDILIQKRRNTKAAKRLMKKLLKREGFTPRVIITDKLKSYGAAFREMGLGIEHRQHKGLNNQAENSHVLDETERKEDAKVQICQTSSEIFVSGRVDLSTNSATKTYPKVYPLGQINSCYNQRKND